MHVHMKHLIAALLIVVCMSPPHAVGQDAGISQEHLDILSKGLERTTEEAMSHLRSVCRENLTANGAPSTDQAVHLCSIMAATNIRIRCRKNLAEYGEVEEIVDLCFKSSVPDTDG